MGTEQLERPTKDDQQKYDDEFERMHKSGAMGGEDPEEKSLRPDEIEDKEQSPDNPEISDPDGEAKPWNTDKITPGLNRRNRKLVIALGGGVSAGVIGIIIGIMSLLQPHFMSQLTNYIESRVSQVPQNAVERRIEYYMARYLMIRALPGDINPATDDRFTYLGRTFTGTMWTNWRGANIEADMIARGQRLVPKVDGYDLISGGRLRADEWVLETRGKNGTITRSELDSKEARQWLRRDSRKNTHWFQLWKRHSIRKNMKRYLGVPRWKPFERKYEATRQNLREKKGNLISTATDYKRESIARVVTQHNEKLPAWLNCLLDKDKCKNRYLNVPNDNPNVPDLHDSNSSQGDEIADAVDGHNSDHGAISRILKRFLLARILSIISTGLGFVDFISKMVQSIDSGALNAVIYNKAVQSYGPAIAQDLSAEDQFQSGDDFDYTAPRSMSDKYKGFQESPVYQQTTAGGKKNADKQIRRDCNDDGDKTDPEDLLDVGEVVCPDKKPVQDVTKTITSNGAWDDLVAFSDAYEGSPANFVADWITAIGDRISSLIGVDAATSSILAALGLDTRLADAMESLLDAIVGAACNGAETGPAAFDCLYGGIQAAATSAAGAVGDRTSEDSTHGGAVISQAASLRIQQESMEQRDFELKHMSLFDRYFSPEVPESLTTYAIINNPGTGVSALNKIGSIFNFSGISSLVSNLGSSKADAATIRNPFGFLDIGYEPDNPVFTDHNGEGMDPDDLQTRFSCSTPVEERPQNQTFGRPLMTNGEPVPFDVNVDPDPCMLEDRAMELGVMAFTGDYDDDIDGSEVTAGANGAPPTGTVTAEDIVDIPGFGSGCHESIAQNVIRMVNDAASAGVVLTGDCWRSSADQISLRRDHCGDSYYQIYQAPSSSCTPPTAIPGTSLHEQGLAIDFDNCHPGESAYIWLSEHADEYGLYNLPSESWHWSTTGG